MKQKTEFDPEDPQERERWLKALDRAGVEAIREKLRQSTSGSLGDLLGVGTVPFMTRGFAEAWVECHERRAQRRKQRWRWATILIAVAGVSGITLWPLIERAWLALTSLVP